MEKLHPPFRKDQYANWIRAQCEMRVGKCKEGQKRLREYLLNLDKDKRKSEEEIDAQVKASSGKCPSSSGNLDERVTRAYTRIGEASRKRDAHACREEAGRIAPLLSQIPKDQKSAAVRAKATGVLMMAAQCLAKAGECKDAWKMYNKYYDAQFAHTMKLKEVREAAKATFPSVAPKCKGKY
jgi:hypothetical protein